MAQLVNRVADVVSDKSQGAVAGKNTGYVAANVAGDYIPLNGVGTLVRLKNTSGAPITATLDSVTASSFGTDVDPVVTVPATTGEVEFFLKNVNRFDAGGANKGFAKITYSGVTNLSIDAVVIPA